MFTPREQTHTEYSIENISETHYIQLPILRKQIKDGSIDLDNPELRLMLILDNETPQYLIEKVMKMDKFANDMYEKAQHFLQNRKDYLMYIRAEQAELDKKAMIRFGKKEGKKEGIKEGKIEGRKEKEIEIATKLKKLNFPIEQIAEITGLAETKIKKL